MTATTQPAQLEREHGGQRDHTDAGAGAGADTGDPAADPGHLAAATATATALDHAAADLSASAPDDAHDQCRGRRVRLLGPRRARSGPTVLQRLDGGFTLHPFGGQSAQAPGQGRGPQVAAMPTMGALR